MDFNVDKKKTVSVSLSSDIFDYSEFFCKHNAISRSRLVDVLLRDFLLDYSKYESVYKENGLKNIDEIKAGGAY